MALRWRLTLTVASLIWALMLGLSVALYAVTVGEQYRSFSAQLEGLAQQYAQAALQPSGVRLREIPSTLVQQRLEGLTVWLMNVNSSVVDQLGSQDAVDMALSDQQLERLKRGLTLSFDRESTPWTVLTGQRRSVSLRPILTLGDRFELRYVLAVSAKDRVGRDHLARLRATTAIWLGIATVCAALLGYRLALWLSRPLREIAQTAYRVGQGELTERIVGASSSDEIGALKRELNAMLERLERLVQAQRRFTADAAHDLRTPLAVLRTELEVSLRHPRSPELYQRSLERLLNRVAALSALCEDLLTLSTLEAGVAQPFEDFLLLDALALPLEVAERRAADASQRFEVLLSPSLELHGNPQLLARLIANLLDNASKAASSEFGLRVQRHGSSVQLQVWDDGAGIAPEQRLQLFERFYKGETSSGAGLGLSIAQEVARAHHTQVRALDSLRGATFEVRLSGPTRHTRNTSELF